MKTIRAVGFQDNDRLRGWGRGLLSVPHASSDHAVGVKMQREVRAGITALLPAGDFVVLHAQAAEMLRSVSNRSRSSSSDRPTCMARVCPPRAPSRSRSYRATSSREPLGVLFAAPGISPRGISGKPRSRDALQPLTQNSKAKNQTAVIHRFIRFRSTWLLDGYRIAH